MHYRRLGATDIQVSQLCLGTMTWGEQNTPQEGYAQMDYALEQGINFFDTAELYSIPPKPETFGRTEEIIGDWFQERGTRDQVILGTKVVGKTPNMPWIRNGQTRLDRDNIKTALEDSLRRLKTDYVDLYQLHWSDRPTNRFGQLGYSRSDADVEDETARLHETLSVLDDVVKSGKVRYVGLSNETPWGVMTFLKLAEEHGLPRIVSIQNPYNLLNRTFEVGLSEVAIHENCGLLAYSPLAGGTLTGKYLDGQMPPGTRRAIDYRSSRYDNPQGEAATRAYLDIAKRHGLDPAQMAIAFVNQQPFLTSNILGATTLDDLKTNIDAAALTLSEEVLAEIEAVHQKHPNPCP